MPPCSEFNFFPNGLYRLGFDRLGFFLPMCLYKAFLILNQAFIPNIFLGVHFARLE